MCLRSIIPRDHAHTAPRSYCHACLALDPTGKQTAKSVGQPAWPHNAHDSLYHESVYRDARQAIVFKAFKARLGYDGKYRAVLRITLWICRRRKPVTLTLHMHFMQTVLLLLLLLYLYGSNAITAVVQKNKTKRRSKIYKSQYILRYNILTVKLQSVVREMRSGSCLLWGLFLRL